MKFGRLTQIEQITVLFHAPKHILHYMVIRPRGKESIEVRKSQIKSKESENSYQELKRSQEGQAHTNTQKLNQFPCVCVCLSLL